MGQILLAKAMADRGHTRTDAEDATGAGQGTIGRVLDNKRGVGMDLADKIAKAYPEVTIASWAQPAPDDAVMVEIPRGRSRSDGDPPEAA